ncbi:MAG: acyl-CoA reductase [Alphaproteobacteria bacterium]|nr:acyl-CoA reductase [Alphaproteobacteria bacterium]MCB9928779.1 acyl-CoA reductase [Alphaproteobacteria bacterium]
MVERAGYLPGLDPTALRWETLTFDRTGQALAVEVPVLGPDEIARLAAHVRRHAAERLRAQPVARVVEAIDRAIARLLDRQDPYRRRMEDLLPVVTGYDREMVRLGLTQYLKTFRKPELLRFLAEDFTNPAMLDGFQPLPKGGLGRAFGPPVLAHIWAGNVPGLPLWSLVSGLLVKAGNIGKLPSAEPLFATGFAQLLAEEAPDLADCLAVVWWPGGAEAPERALLQVADLTLAYGGTESLAAIQGRMPPARRFLAYGHKVSFAMIAAAALDPAKAGETARRAAHDVARYDQQGCFAPHVVFVERGGPIPPRTFARYLARELAAFGERYPRRGLTLAETSAVAAWRQREEFAQGGTVLGDAAGSWSVSVHEGEAGFGPSCLNRAVRVVAVDDLAAVPAMVAPFRPLLQTVGLAAPPEDLVRLAAALGEAGVTRISALGDMTAPEAGWHHDGRFNLLDLVQICEIDARAETVADRLAGYAD